MERLEDRIRMLVAALERLEGAWRSEHSLTANEALVITSLATDGPLTPTAISQRVGLTTAGMSTLLDRLEAEGYLQRRRSPDDRRRVLVTLTKRALRARMGLETVHGEIARAVPTDQVECVEAFLATAEASVLRRAGVAGDDVQ